MLFTQLLASKVIFIVKEDFATALLQSSFENMYLKFRNAQELKCESQPEHVCTLTLKK